MKDQERTILTGVLSLLLVTWLGFLFHRSPRFAGSSLGIAFGIAGAVLLLIPLAYPIAKRIPSLHNRITAHVSLPALLAIHVYAGIFGPLFAIIHTGHKFNGGLGIALTAVMLLVVVSGFALRYLLPFTTHDIKDKLLLLQTARGDLDSAWGVLENTPTETKVLPEFPHLAAALASLEINLATTSGPADDVTRIAESVADLEYAIRTDELFKRWFGYSLTAHIVLSILLYVLLGLHIWAGFHLGLRAFS